jgi:DNA polymerase alpha-associated DNA helicase A
MDHLYSIKSRYQAQLALLSEALSPTLPGLEIGTVDGMQGREKDAVVISLVRSNDKVISIYLEL